jgi:hypothetical protein
MLTSDKDIDEGFFVVLNKSDLYEKFALEFIETDMLRTYSEVSMIMKFEGGMIVLLCLCFYWQMGKLRFGAKIDTEMKYEDRCTQIFYDKDVLDKLGMEKYLGLQSVIPAAPFL